MNAAVQQELPVVLGAPFAGGFFLDCLNVDGRPHAIIVAPKADGEHADVIWRKKWDRIAGALSYNDSYANTVAMAEAGSEVAQWARAQRIGGFEDWCIPARDVLERMYRFGKPGTAKNYCYYRSGENPSGIPVGYPYTEDRPGQTLLDPFKEGGAEAFDQVWHWSSTQYKGHAACAWAQNFGYGNQSSCRRGNECRVRLVRVIPI